MKIGIFLYKINPNYFGGVNSYVAGLLEGFKAVDKENDYILFVNSQNKHLFLKFQEHNFSLKEISIDGGLTRKIKRIFVDYFAILPVVRILFPVIYKLAYKKLIAQINLSGVDVMYCPYEFPIYWKKPTVVSMHDIQFFHFPQFFSLGQRWHREVFYKNTAKTATVLQASSEYIKQDFIKYFGVLPEKVIVVRDGINEIFKNNLDPKKLEAIKSQYNLPDKFVFYPAQHWAHKNHLNLIKAIHFLKTEKNLNMCLVLTGEKRKETELLLEEIDSLGLSDSVKMIGNIPFNNLPYLYKLANLAAIPSNHESNSLPAMEAMAVGCAVAASNIEPNVELNANGAMIIFDRNDYKDIAEKIKLLWQDAELREEKIRLGKELSAQFSWNKTVKDYITIFKK